MWPRLINAALLLLIPGIRTLQMTSLKIPHHVIMNQTVKLECNFNLDHELLYSVKWYKNGNEFYRYLPTAETRVQVFPVDGVYVDKRGSTDKSVVLRNVDSSSSGRYRCEVSAEAPFFQTVSDHADMTVVVLPDVGPTITGGKSRYRKGDVVRLNCTSARSKPAAFLTWFINDETANPQYLKGPHITAVDENGLETAMLGLEFRATSKHFKHGDMKLKCLAKIATVYVRSNEHSVEGDESVLKAPVMESRGTRAQSHTRNELANGSATGDITPVRTILFTLVAISLSR